MLFWAQPITAPANSTVRLSGPPTCLLTETQQTAHTHTHTVQMLSIVCLSPSLTRYLIQMMVTVSLIEMLFVLGIKRS